jgi:hypothetical protein
VGCWPDQAAPAAATCNVNNSHLYDSIVLLAEAGCFKVKTEQAVLLLLLSCCW